MSVTIKDVAALAGVSASTVSRTCKNSPSISEETKRKVRNAMKELGYEPNFQASNLASETRAPSALSFRYLPVRSMKTPFIWKRSAASARSATSSIISAPS